MIFGAGIERTSEDFGFQGEWPTHPELLEFLATEFRDSGWDLRRMLREIVTSATYRQSSAPFGPSVKERDPDNRLLARYARRRQTAEQIRDHALYTSGLLVEKLGGPSVKTVSARGALAGGGLAGDRTRRCTSVGRARICTGGRCTRTGSGRFRRRTCRHLTRRHGSTAW
jgi:hypothetical protein